MTLFEMIPAAYFEIMAAMHLFAVSRQSPIGFMSQGLPAALAVILFLDAMERLAFF